jgi:hypothetical protein
VLQHCALEQRVLGKALHTREEAQQAGSGGHWKGRKLYSSIATDAQPGPCLRPDRLSGWLPLRCPSGCPWLAWMRCTTVLSSGLPAARSALLPRRKG